LILSVKFCDQETGTNLHTQEKNKRFSTLQLLIAISPFCHVLSGAISIITRVGTRAHVHFVMMFGDPSVTQRTQKTWPDTSTSSTIMMNCCSFDGCENRPTKNGNGRCRTHGGRTKCNHLGCDSFAQKGGKSVGVIDLINYVAAQQVAPTCPKRMEFARIMVELEFVKFMDVQGVYFSPECAIFMTKTQLFALQLMRMQW
jgi:hypothetical protein